MYILNSNLKLILYFMPVQHGVPSPRVNVFIEYSRIQFSGEFISSLVISFQSTDDRRTQRRILWHCVVVIVKGNHCKNKMYTIKSQCWRWIGDTIGDTIMVEETIFRTDFNTNCLPNSSQSLRVRPTTAVLLAPLVGALSNPTQTIPLA